jgi:hypothetical protein
VHFGGVEGGADAARRWLVGWKSDSWMYGDSLVQGDHDAAAAGVGAAGESYGLQEVQGPVGAQGGGGTHRADDDDRFGGVDGHLQEEGRFF